MLALRRTSRTSVAAISKLAQRAQATRPATTTAPINSSLDPAVAPPTRLRQTFPTSPGGVPCAATRDPADPALRAAQAKDAALLAKVANDFFAAAGANWQLEFTTIKYADSVLTEGEPFALNADYLAALALARGSSMSTH